MPRRQALFWDVNPRKVDPQKHKRYIIERILDFGTDKEVRWVWETYQSRLIRDVVLHSQAVFPRTRELWLALTKREKT